VGRLTKFSLDQQFGQQSAAVAWNASGTRAGLFGMAASTSYDELASSVSSGL
jgi:hypothetical protein